MGGDGIDDARALVVTRADGTPVAMLAGTGGADRNGAVVGAAVAARVGTAVGTGVAARVGAAVGSAVATRVGTAVGSGAGAALGAGLAVRAGAGVAVGAGVATGVAVAFTVGTGLAGAGVAVRTGTAVATRGTGVDDGAGAAVGSGVGEGEGVSSAVARAIGTGVAVAVADGEGRGVEIVRSGVACGATLDRGTRVITRGRCATRDGGASIALGAGDTASGMRGGGSLVRADRAVRAVRGCAVRASRVIVSGSAAPVASLLVSLTTCNVIAAMMRKTIAWRTIDSAYPAANRRLSPCMCATRFHFTYGTFFPAQEGFCNSRERALP